MGGAAEAPPKRNHSSRSKGNKPKALRPYRLLRIELGRMRRLYDACLYSFSISRSQLESGLKSGALAPSSSIVAPGSDRVLAWSPLEMLERMKETYPEMLRASLLVRAVSHMENYLVDLLNEIAKRSLAPFKQQDKMISLSQAQLLSFESAEQLRGYLVAAECRAFNGKGFREFEKYYKRRFNIALSQSPVPIDDVDGIYARRHLLVHAGGVIDNQFQRRYSPQSHVGEQLHVPEDYFVEALQKLERLAEYCATRIEALYPDATSGLPSPAVGLREEFSDRFAEIAALIVPDAKALAAWFSASFRSSQVLDAHFADDATFYVEEKPHQTKDIVVGIKRTGERTVHWLVCGNKSVVGPYIAYLEYLYRRGIIEDLEKHNVSVASGLRTAKTHRIVEMMANNSLEANRDA